MLLRPITLQARRKRNGIRTKRGVFLLFTCATGTFFTLSLHFNTAGHWRLLRVPYLPQIFADSHYVTSAWECVRQATCDVFAEGAGWGGWVYPKIWLFPSGIGLGQDATIPFAILMAAAFLVGLWFVTDPMNGWSSFIYILAFFSPAVMVGLERGNIDLLVFSLVAAACFALRAERRIGEIIAGSVIVLASFLKLYPVAGLLPLSHGGRWSVRRLSIVLAIVSGFVVMNINEILRVAQVVPRDVWLSTGGQVILKMVRLKFLGSSLEFLFSSPFVYVLYFVLLAVAVCLAIGLATVLGRIPVPPQHDRWRFDALLISSSIYTTSFAVGISYDYRLVFLLLALPQLLDWAGSHTLLARVAEGTIAIVLLLMHTTVFTAPPLFVLNELLAWSLFVVLVGVLFAAYGIRLRSEPKRRLNDFYSSLSSVLRIHKPDAAS